MFEHDVTAVIELFSPTLMASVHLLLGEQLTQHHWVVHFEDPVIIETPSKLLVLSLGLLYPRLVATLHLDLQCICISPRASLVVEETSLQTHIFSECTLHCEEISLIFEGLSSQRPYRCVRATCQSCNIPHTIGLRNAS